MATTERPASLWVPSWVWDRGDDYAAQYIARGADRPAAECCGHQGEPRRGGARWVCLLDPDHDGDHG